MNAHLLRCCALYSAQKPEPSLPHKDKRQHKGVETEVGRGKISKTKGGKAYLERGSQNSLNPKDKRQPRAVKAASLPPHLLSSDQGLFHKKGNKQTNTQQVYIFTFQTTNKIN